MSQTANRTFVLCPNYTQNRPGETKAAHLLPKFLDFLLKPKFHRTGANGPNHQHLLYSQTHMRIGLAYNFISKELALIVILSVEFVA
jgi:hypothetical protein